MNTQQNIILTNLANAIYWASNFMWKESRMPLDSQLEDIRWTRKWIESALKELQEYEENLKNK
jgi:hypothetical protein